MQASGGVKSQQPAVSCSSPQLAGTLLWTAAAPEGNLLPDTQSADNKISAAWDITATSSLYPQAAFSSAAVAQQLVKLLSSQSGHRDNLPHSQTTPKQGIGGGSVCKTPSMSNAETRDNGQSAREAGLPAEKDLLSQPLQNEAEERSEVLMTAANAERPPGIELFDNPHPLPF